MLTETINQLNNMEHHMPKVGPNLDLGDYGDGLWVFEEFGSGYGYMDDDGKIVIEPRFDYAEEFHEGLAIVRIDDDESQYYFINKNGEKAFGAHFSDAKNFSEGLAPVSVGDYDESDDDAGEWHYTEWGYINTNGEMVISPIYDDAEPFSEGMAAVKKEGLWGFINKAGEMVIKPQFGYACTFENGRARVETSIDKEGKPVAK